ncbi:MAG: LCP family protein [Firmicutes bacterium]|nr:LCP family protein [Bacillota bacterium]
MVDFFRNTFSFKELIQTYKAGQLDKRTVKKGFIIFICSVTSYLILAAIVTMLLLARDNSVHIISTNNATFAQNSSNLPNVPSQNLPTPPTAIELPIIEETDETEETAEIEELAIPARTNVLLLGIDNVGLADVIIVASFERESGEINLLSIPRDTYTLIPPERIANMRNDGVWVPNTGIVKINAVRSLGGPNHGIRYMQEQLAETLGIQFDYFVEINIRAFREIVDIIGGVEIEVPQAMNYHDPYQNLRINIPAGLHLMNGAMAEQFVRYRGYANADLGRINAQQQFMTQLFRQAMTRDALLSNPIGMIQILLQNVQTDIGLDLLNYIPYIGNLNPELIFTYTLPGEERRIQGSSFWLPDSALVPDVVNRMFHGIVNYEYANADLNVSYLAARPEGYQSARIAVLNGSNIGGVAMNVSNRLTMSGFNIDYVGPYTGPRRNQTYINVRDEKLGKAINRYFRNAVVNVDENLSDEFDIIIVAGRNEQ